MYSCFGSVSGSESVEHGAVVEDAEPFDFGDVQGGFDEEFQDLMEVVNRDESVLAEVDTFQKLSRLVQDFRHAVMTYGKIIISERHLPMERKTIKPVFHVGGVAGGEKYIASNVLFRLPRDIHNLYGSDELAAKEANHQMKGLTAMYNASVSGLSLPLLAVINYRGFKLVAMSMLPIRGKDTLCYGSSDGGRSMRKANDSAAALMEETASILNLAKHPVLKSELWLHMPCDMEVHKVEHRHYVVDFARLFPPQAFALQKKSGHLVYLLRPELVQQFKKPLSSDAFSRFASEAYSEFNEDVKEATDHLFSVIVPRIAKALESTKKRYRQPDHLARFFHEYGVNMRFLGIVFGHIESPEIKVDILLEATARVVKALVRASMRLVEPNVRTAVVTPYITCVTKTLNHVLGRTKCFPGCCSLNAYEQHHEDEENGEEIAKRRHWWCKRLPKLLEEWYHFDFKSNPLQAIGCTLGENSCCCGCLWKQLVDPSKLCLRVQSMCGIVFSPTTQEAITKPIGLQSSVRESESQGSESTLSSRRGGVPDMIFDLFEPFQDTDIGELAGTIQVLPIMEYAQGTELFIRARKKHGQGATSETKRLLEMSLQRFDDGLAISPRDSRLLCNRGFLLDYLHTTFPNEFQDLSGFSDFIKSAMYNRRHARTWYYMATTMDRAFQRNRRTIIHEWVEKISKLTKEGGLQVDPTIKAKSPFTRGIWRVIDMCFRRALEANPQLVNCLKDYANFQLYTLHRKAEAMRLYRAALGIDPLHIRTMQNLARLQIEGELWAEARETVEQLLEVDPKNPIVLLDYAGCLICSNGFIKDAYGNSATFCETTLLQEHCPDIIKAIEITTLAIHIMQKQAVLDTELGHRRSRYFDADMPEIHASLAVRASKLLCKISFHLLSLSNAQPTNDITATIQHAREHLWGFLDFAVDVVEHDSVYAETHNVELSQPQKSREIAFRLLKQLCQAELVRAKCLCIHVDPTIVFDHKIPTRSIDYIKSLKQEQIPSFRSAESKQVDEETLTTSMQTLGKVEAIFRKVMRLDPRPRSAAEMLYFQYRLHFYILPYGLSPYRSTQELIHSTKQKHARADHSHF
mmetsp:Transcript_41851/g.67155  ORF Transcript_41851/g.67155 Transcript_41851/m.67155 type:complete len:1087 (+) Transcript_41851:142-3402(+)|eukprot:CAMPEP_0203752828 /NCGR_PEP_ID=MMETSP0098-20131031/6695_1 /ASSEMBLY_ACC=CAM_ASM_000208 /TAXON_ID=96639 /ORGANISM=" , Strain NY0313808BC1" /LENGTH=1086 /DNA_ID=CAMNT_0050643169 /DNA_START=39 /DNA_END=3299 /DNA_ORIENTATION=+